MCRYGEPVKVLAVFEPGNNPRPYKVKYKGRTITVDEITDTDSGFSFIGFSCTSYLTEEDYIQKFELIYVKDQMEWQLKLKQ